MIQPRIVPGRKRRFARRRNEKGELMSENGNSLRPEPVEIHMRVALVCPHCLVRSSSKVIDTKNGSTVETYHGCDAPCIRRRRECSNCGERYTTRELVFVDVGASELWEGEKWKRLLLEAEQKI